MEVPEGIEMSNEPMRPQVSSGQCGLHGTKLEKPPWQRLGRCYNTSSFLLLVAMPGAPSSVLAPSSKARSP